MDIKQLLGDFSIREKNLWFELLLDLGIALYYWPRVFALIRAGDGALSGAAMVGLITSTVILAIVLSSLLSVFLHVQQKPEPMDERDRDIQARAGLWSHRVLVVGVLLVIGQVVVQELASPALAARSLLQATPLVLAHLLLVALMLASFVHSAYRLFCYRRGC